VALEETVLGQFLGDDAFPIEWGSETEKKLFWVFDDLHCPHPLSPMFEEIGGWWLSCDHMFRRFGTPFAFDWIIKNVNGYLYTAAVPAEAGIDISSMEYGARYGARVPLDPQYPNKIGKYLDAVLPVYGLHFADWWRDRLVPEMQRNFAYLEDRLDHQADLSLMELACVSEDAIDIHDRHWKIHWMLNFAQLSATLNLRAVMEKTHGKIDEALLGRLQNSAKDRNWDSIEALWQAKQDVKADAELASAFGAAKVDAMIANLRASEHGRRFITERIEPYQREYGWHAVWSHEFIFPSYREQMEPVIELVRGYIEQDYDYPKTIAAAKADIDSAATEIMAGLAGDPAAEMRRALDNNLRMAPLTPDHHFYIDQGANAHMRLVLIAIGARLVEMGMLDRSDDVLFFRYNELRVFMGEPDASSGRALVAQRRAERERSYKFKPRDWIGTCTPTQLAFPYLINWGFPDKFNRSQQKAAADATPGRFEGIAGSPGVVEGIARVVLSETEFDKVQPGDILVCQMTNPAWVVLFTKIAALVTDAGGVSGHPAVLSREFGIPAVVGSSVATQVIKSGDRIRVDGTAGVVEVLS
jgi:Phosphoenolpyruvate synthase/pyruvate phosphate dikinase